MSEDKQKLYARVKALLAKTAEANCTEAEAQFAAEKARELIEIYQLDMTEGELISEGFTEILFRWSSRERANIQQFLSTYIGYYTGTRAWMTNDGKTQQRVNRHFFGLKSDVMFAGFLMTHLSDFVIRSADEYVKNSFHPYYNAKKERASFIMGCAARIAKRLKEERHNTIQVKGTGTALVTVDKRKIVTQQLAARGVLLVSKPASSKTVHSAGSYEAGKAQGNAASFSRPLGGNVSAPKAIGK